MAIVQNANAGVVINESYVVGVVWQSFPPYDEAYLEVNPRLNSSGSFDAADVPEPTSVALWLMGGIGAVTSGYRRRRMLTSVPSGRTAVP